MKSLIKIIITLISIVFVTVAAYAQVGRAVAPLFARSSTLWSTVSINVCWENPIDANLAQRNLVRNAVRNSWEAVSPVRFIGWNQCAPDSRGIRILINDEGPHVKKLGRELDGLRNGMVLNFTFNNWSTGCSSNPNACIGPIAVHEFGHALGFAHEQNRPDCRCNDSPQGTSGDWLVTPCDINSVMMYCNPNWNNNGQLSGYDIMGVRKLYGHPNGRVSVFDETGLIEIAVFTASSPNRTQHSDLRISVPSDYLVIGGGGTASNLGEGALLTASYPSIDLSSWMLSSKDHLKPHSHVLTGYAIALKIRGLTAEQLRGHIVVREAMSAVTNHPSATADLPADYSLIGGGFRVNWRGQGNLATASFPVGNAWAARSKDHQNPDPASIVSYAVGIRNSIPGVGNIEARIFSLQSDMKQHPSVSVPVQRGYALAGGGGEVVYSGAGNMIWELCPDITNSDNQVFKTSSKDHGTPSNAFIKGYSIGVRVRR